MAQLWPGLGATIWCMSRSIHPRGTIHERYKNIPQGNKLEGLILVGESNISLWKKGAEVPVYYFFHRDSVDVEFFASRDYIRVV